ncbi:MAG: YceI family protein [Parvibaculum sp.]
MKFVKSIALALMLVALLTGCTAVKVVTHEVSGNTTNVVSGTYKLDPHHWSLIFDVDHFGYSRFVMRFDRMQATLDIDAGEIAKSRAHVTIDAASVDTNNPELDAIITGDQMFDAALFPTITFEGVSLKPTGEKTATLVGNLTIHGQSHPVTLDVTFNGGAPDPLTGEDTLGFSADGHFDRSRWGLSAWWPAVGNDVHVAIQAEFVRVRDK